MYQRILVPLDGSKLAEQVLPYVRLVAFAFGSRIELLRTFDAVPPTMEDTVHGRYLHQIEANVRARSLDYLRDIKVVYDPTTNVSCTVDLGEPASWIVREAEKEADTLIAMSTHGRSGMTRWVLGSVADQVLHATKAPLLLFRSQDEETPPKEASLASVIVPLDGSSLAEQALPHTVALAQALCLSVTLVRVSSHHGEAEARDYLLKVAGKLHQQGVSSLKEVVLNGHPGTAIVDIARDIPNCLVTMTTHGHSGIGRWILGSVTDQVVRQSGSPVLVVHPRVRITHSSGEAINQEAVTRS
jgi:nucleotide-binding universal stress UspA family protein